MRMPATETQIARELRAMSDHGTATIAGVLVHVRRDGYDIGGELFNREDEAVAEIRQYG